MSSIEHDNLPDSPKPWQRKSSTQLIAVAVGVLPIYILAILMRLLADRSFGLSELMLYPLLVGGAFVVVIILLLRFVCGVPLRVLNLKPGVWWRDVLAGVILTGVFMLLAVIEQATISRWIRQEPAQDIETLMEGLSQSPLLLALWLGPVVWIGVAGFEELTRIFMLNRLWAVWSKPGSKWIVLILSAALFGLAHLYQGTLGVLSTGLMGFIAGWFYMVFGRTWPLIISHALYDSAWIVVGVVMFRRGVL